MEGVADQQDTKPATALPPMHSSLPPTPPRAPLKSPGRGSFSESKATAPPPAPPSSIDGDAEAKLIVVGVCARDKKVYSKPMTEILARFPKDIFKIVIFGDKVLFEEPPERWPLCDCLMAFYSSGFPLHKAEAYVALRKPYCVNDISVEHLLLDRRCFYSRLVEYGINVPRHIIVNRDGPGPTPNLIETDDYVELDGKRILKPFVEKPVDAEDHNVYIYYPDKLGGGSKRLFRKVGNHSSHFYPDISTVRREGSYIYEEFIMTQGTDIKIYAVGPEYAHAEARKSPVLDGVVQRDTSGKEIRYPIMLNGLEKTLAHKVVQAFGLNVCGFDLLRTSETSYICDVNGWSFVKKSHKYYDDCSAILQRLMLMAVSPAKLRLLPTPRTVKVPLSKKAKRRVGSKQMEELRCVVAVVRHGDRTPKQKMKMKVTHPAFLELFQKYGAGENRCREIKLKAPKQLQDVLEIAQRLLAAERGEDDSEDAPLPTMKLRQIVHVLQRGSFQGINRKVQLKPLKVERVKADRAPKIPSISAAWLHVPAEVNPALAARPDITLPDLKSALVATPSLRTHHRDESKSESESDDGFEEVVAEAQLILKWGGVLTPAGRGHSAQLGSLFRQCMYPGESMGLLRLHSTYRHDLKIYSSEEGRVQMTAAAFAKEFLCLEGRLTPILASLVRFSNTSELLDDTSNARGLMDSVKRRLHSVLASCRSFGLDDESESVMSGPVLSPTADATAAESPRTVSPLRCSPDSSDRRPAVLGLEKRSFPNTPAGMRSASTDSGASFLRGGLRTVNSTASVSSMMAGTPMEKYNPQVLLSQIDPELLQEVAPTRDVSLLKSLIKIGPVPRKSLKRLYSLCAELSNELRVKVDGEVGLGAKMTCNNETYLLMAERWAKLTADFYRKKKDKFDLSKVPDIYDCIKYDCLHNPFILSPLTEELFDLSKAFADLIIPQEYGITLEEKAQIAASVCHNLFQKLQFDFASASGLPIPGKAPAPPATHASRPTQRVPRHSSGLPQAERAKVVKPALPVRLREESKTGNKPGNKLAKQGTPAVGMSANHPHPAPVKRSTYVEEGAEELYLHKMMNDDAEIPSRREGRRESDQTPHRVDLRATPGTPAHIPEDVAGEAAAEAEAATVHHGSPLQGLVAEGRDRPGSPGSLLSVPSADEGAAVRGEAAGEGAGRGAGAGKGEGEAKGAKAPAGSPTTGAKPRRGSSGSLRSFRRSRRRKKPQEFNEEVTALDESVCQDAGYTDIKSPMRRVRTRVYFTSESHVHCLVNAFTAISRMDPASAHLLSEEAVQALSMVSELDYLTHIVFRMYENVQVADNDPHRFRVEILFSPGCTSEGTESITPAAAHARVSTPLTTHSSHSDNPCADHMLPPSPLFPLRTTLNLKQLHELLNIWINAEKPGSDSDS